MFGLTFLSRKLGAAPSSSGTTGTVTASPDIPSSNVVEAKPPATPSPPPQDLITDPNPLHALIASVPAQTLHAYTLANIIPPHEPLSPLSFPHIPLPSDPPSPKTITSLTNFFANLVPPPRLHCVRCHKGYFEVENSDRSCLVPHDDESAEVERVGASSRSKGIETEYETLWGCCGKTVEGDGDMGPPDGWCYEGKHTTDIRRARFRADSTLQDDKLTSCERLRCHHPPRSSTSPRVSISSRGRASAKRRRAVMEEADNEDAQSSAGGSVVSGSPSANMHVDVDASATRKPKRARHSKSASISSSVVDGDKPKKADGDDDVTMMDVEGTTTSAQPQVPATPNSPPRRRKSRKSSAAGAPATPGVKARTKAKAKSPLASSFTPPSPPSEEDEVQVRGNEKAPLPLPRPIVEIATERDGSPKLSKSSSRGNLRKPLSSNLKEDTSSDSDAQPDKKEKPKPKPRTRTRKSTAETSTPKTPKPTSKDASTTSATAVKPKSSSTGLKIKCSAASLKPTSRAKPPSKTASTEESKSTPAAKPTSLRKKRTKALVEVVGTSVDGEENL